MPQNSLKNIQMQKIKAISAVFNRQTNALLGKKKKKKNKSDEKVHCDCYVKKGWKKEKKKKNNEK